MRFSIGALTPKNRGEAAAGAAVDWSPAGARVTLALLLHEADVCFRGFWLEGLAVEPAAPGFGIWIMAGFGAKNRGSLVV